MLEKKFVFKHSLVVGIIFVVMMVVMAAPVYGKSKVKKRRPAKPKITSVKASGNTIKVKIKKVKTARKYQIAFKQQNAGRWTKKKNKKAVYTIKKCRYAMKYQVKEGTQPGDQVSFKNRGIIDKNSPSYRGDHTIRFVVEIPQKLSDEQKRMLRAFEETLTDKNYTKKNSFFEKVKKIFR